MAEATPANRPNDLGNALLARYHDVRRFTERLCEGLQPEDCVVQSMPDVSPTKWHLAHTSWFFETFILKVWMPEYQPEIPEYAYLFNSYYNAAGSMHRRDLRGLISRPTLAETFRFRRSIDEQIEELLGRADKGLLAEMEPVFTIGLHHEQQHQELLVTDIKHVFAQNPLHPVYRQREKRIEPRRIGPMTFVDFEETIFEIGYDGRGFSYDNEGPRHRALVPAFSLATRLVTNGEYLQFMEDGGYRRPEFWLSLGWMTLNEPVSGGWEAPLYWEKRDGRWWNFTLSGMRPVDESEPVTHISHFEADAFANWSGARLPTEFEWERAAQDFRLRTGDVILGQLADFLEKIGATLVVEELARQGARRTRKPGDRLLEKIGSRRLEIEQRHPGGVAVHTRSRARRMPVNCQRFSGWKKLR